MYQKFLSLNAILQVIDVKSYVIFNNYIWYNKLNVCKIICNNILCLKYLMYIRFVYFFYNFYAINISFLCLLFIKKRLVNIIIMYLQ